MADVTRKGLLQPIDVQGLLAAREAGILTSSMPTGEMSSVEPSMRDQIAQWLATMISDDENRQRYVEQKAGGVMDLVPGLGAAVGGDEAGRDLGAGNYLSGGLGLAMSAIPGAKAAKKGIKAFHGSPHSFDKFSMDKIGTGEGAQAQGYGLYLTDSKRLANAYRRADPEKHKGPGHLYEVQIDADPDEFLERERLISEQGEGIQNAAKQVRENAARTEYERRGIPPEVAEEYLRNAVNKDRTGKQLVQALEGSMGPEAASEAMKQAGIKGIRYGTDGNQVFVVFDEKLLEIVGKYGIAGALGAGMISEQMAEQLQSQGYT
jgi:hypothetical protein